jgi:hypothetical protein
MKPTGLHRGTLDDSKIRKSVSALRENNTVALIRRSSSKKGSQRDLHVRMRSRAETPVADTAVVRKRRLPAAAAAADQSHRLLGVEGVAG